MVNRITLIDAGTGNLRSVHKALQSLGAEVNLTNDPETVSRAGKVVLPGVGAFGDFMKGLRETGMDEAVISFAGRGNPLLGICVGMQALFDVGLEMGRHAGLGLLPGKVVRFPNNPGLKVPHTGWNQLVFRKESSLWENLEPGAYAYFNHSFYCEPADPSDTAALTGYGLEFASAVHREQVFGVQFHPEKSQRVGLRILQNFLDV